MRRRLFVGVFVTVFALSATTALANDNNDNRIGVAPLIPCYGLYQAGVGNPPFSGPGGAPSGATVGTPGYSHVFENDLEMCHDGD